MLRVNKEFLSYMYVYSIYILQSCTVLHTDGFRKFLPSLSIMVVSKNPPTMCVHDYKNSVHVSSVNLSCFADSLTHSYGLSLAVCTFYTLVYFFALMVHFCLL